MYKLVDGTPYLLIIYKYISRVKQRKLLSFSQKWKNRAKIEQIFFFSNRSKILRKNSSLKSFFWIFSAREIPIMFLIFCSITHMGDWMLTEMVWFNYLSKVLFISEVCKILLKIYVFGNEKINFFEFFSGRENSFGATLKLLHVMSLWIVISNINN